MRKPLPSREARRRLAVSLRLTRTPETMPSVGIGAQQASSLGMSAGSFWPSPSRVTMMSPLAACTPVRMPRLWPRLRPWRSTRSWGISAFRAASACGGAVGRAVIDEDDLMGLAGQRGRDLAGQGGDIARLVLDRDHGGNRDRHACQAPSLALERGPYTGPGLCNIGAGPT